MASTFRHSPVLTSKADLGAAQLRLLDALGKVEHAPRDKRLALAAAVHRLAAEAEELAAEVAAQAGELAPEEDVPEEAPEDYDLTEPAPAPLERTESQVAKALVVERVAQTAEEREGAISTLVRTVSQVVRDGAALPEPEVRNLTQQCRDFTEDLVEGMVALDNLSQLAAPDRQDRKQTLRVIEPLLEELDKTKARLVQMQKALDADLAAKAQAEAAEHAAKRARRDARAELPAVDWRRAKARVRLQVQQEPGAYVLTAALPGVDAQELQLRVERGRLVVRGVKRPDAAQLQRLHAGARELAGARPELAQQRQDLLRLVADGEFGAFEEAIELTPEVDTDRIAGGLDAGVLRVVLPRRAPRRPDWTSSGFW